MTHIDARVGYIILLKTLTQGVCGQLAITLVHQFVQSFSVSRSRFKVFKALIANQIVQPERCKCAVYFRLLNRHCRNPTVFGFAHKHAVITVWHGFNSVFQQRVIWHGIWP